MRNRCFQYHVIFVLLYNDKHVQAKDSDLFVFALCAIVSIESELKCHRGLLKISDFKIAVRNDGSTYIY